MRRLKQLTGQPREGCSPREDLAAKKARGGKDEPGDILAERAANVAEKVRKKKQKKTSSTNQLAQALSKVIKGPTAVKEEVDYDDDEDGNGTRESGDGSSGEEDDDLVRERGARKDTLGQHKKLRAMSSREPGKLMALGFGTMHDQVGTHFGGEVSKSGKLSPVAVRYLLSFAMPQFAGGVSHHKYRELRTLATALDMMVLGRTGQAGFASTAIQSHPHVLEGWF